jgi:MraZ protein
MLDATRTTVIFGAQWGRVGTNGEKVMLLTGTFPRALDDKFRVAIPKQFRSVLASTPEAKVYVAPGTDGSLAIYSEEAFQAFASRLAQASPAAKEVRAFGRLFYAQAQAIELDSQGRVRVSPELARSAGLTKEALLIGVNDHLELWDRDRWEKYVADKQSQFDELAESALK